MKQEHSLSLILVVLLIILTVTWGSPQKEGLTVKEMNAIKKDSKKIYDKFGGVTVSEKITKDFCCTLGSQFKGNAVYSGSLKNANDGKKKDCYITNPKIFLTYEEENGDFNYYQSTPKVKTKYNIKFLKPNKIKTFKVGKYVKCDNFEETPSGGQEESTTPTLSCDNLNKSDCINSSANCYYNYDTNKCMKPSSAFERKMISLKSYKNPTTSNIIGGTDITTAKSSLKNITDINLLISLKSDIRNILFTSPKKNADYFRLILPEIDAKITPLPPVAMAPPVLPPPQLASPVLPPPELTPVLPPPVLPPPELTPVLPPPELQVDECSGLTEESCNSKMIPKNDFGLMFSEYSFETGCIWETKKCRKPKDLRENAVFIVITKYTKNPELYTKYYNILMSNLSDDAFKLISQANFNKEEIKNLSEMTNILIITFESKIQGMSDFYQAIYNWLSEKLYLKCDTYSNLSNCVSNECSWENNKCIFPIRSELIISSISDVLKNPKFYPIVTEKDSDKVHSLLFDSNLTKDELILLKNDIENILKLNIPSLKNYHFDEIISGVDELLTQKNAVITTPLSLPPSSSTTPTTPPPQQQQQTLLSLPSTTGTTPVLQEIPQLEESDQTTQESEPEESGLSPLAIGGIVAGGIVLLLIIGGGIYAMSKKSRKPIAIQSQY